MRSAIGKLRTLPIPTWETGCDIQDPNTLGLAKPEFILYATSIFHDGTLTQAAFDSEKASVEMTLHGYTGRDEEMFSCKLALANVQEARLNFDGTDIYGMKLDLEGETGYRVKIFTAYEISEIVFQDLAVSDWREFKELPELKPLILQANCNF